MDAGAVLNDALVLVRRAMKERSFAAKGNSFFRRTEGGNTMVLGVQRSLQSSRAAVLVTLNYGVYSARVGMGLQEDPESARDVWQAHWRRRLADDGRERWLSVDAAVTANACAESLLAAIDEILPALVAHSTDETLRDEWLSGMSPGLTNSQRLLYAAILVNELGPAERLPGILSELRGIVAGGVHEGLIERRLERAGVRLP